MPANPIDKIALLHLREGKILSTRSKGRDAYYIPGGKREPGETDAQALVREIREELSVDLDPESLHYAGTFEAPAHGHPDGVTVRMTCYTGVFTGEPAPDNEIAEIVWLSHADRARSSPVDRLIFDDLHNRGLLL